VKARPKMLLVKAREVFTAVNCWASSGRSDFQENLLMRSEYELSEVELCKITSCSFSSLIEAGEARIIWGPLLPVSNSMTGH